ncbi:MAG TPA: hypothetical protein PKK07_03460, partial [bacterium]|nr:hypothetical protein [bacterium]
SNAKRCGEGIAVFSSTSSCIDNIDYKTKVFSLNKSLLKILEQIIPSWIFFFYFLPLFINLFTNYGFRPQDYEVVEFILSLGIMLYLIDGYKKEKWWDVLDSMELKTPLTIILRLSS